ncbi:MAG TPA: hypothetical protein PLR07_05815, partial [Promineifilum sp.]|nr:hypothetical protein [Promineifilum sp.]
PADPSPVVPATTAPTLPPATSAAIATTPPPITPTTPAVALPADSLMTGPLVGFYIEDTYEDLYLSIYDAGTGAFRVIQSATPIYIDEAQWFDAGSGRAHQLRQHRTPLSRSELCCPCRCR